MWTQVPPCSASHLKHVPAGPGTQVTVVSSASGTKNKLQLPAFLIPILPQAGSGRPGEEAGRGPPSHSPE